MKTSAFFLAALSAGTLLLSSCGDAKTSETATSDTSAAADSAAGMDHSQMNHAAAPDMMGLMHGMMKNMDSFQPAGNTDYDFAQMMMAHHKGAVEMSALELKDGKDATLRAMAEKILADQQQEILDLDAAATRLDGVPANYKPTDPADPFTSKMKTSMDGMMTNMGQASGNVDQDYANLMVPHHQSAVDMARAEVAHGRDAKLKQMAQQMIAAQEKEIQQFKDWQAKNGGQTKPSAATYECPMGDGGRSNAPGKCPKCGMDLEKKA
ncbi:DUF305 domain-containing protein [Hymenobacter cellulosilyticus]|uniref:DUF305 domain-containing protein n=1 Tax=Hymenobacter cellulosilyticus TaxID=2932248 RepID=A0A8T9PXH1_9BACT|nr:DUF305 domain-containing protein [Hymenobacter cellulosilyticus]UOQ69964.1 DUF305 domain-containing protein [Hymenobacter cellulosilyticus]